MDIFEIVIENFHRKSFEKIAEIAAAPQRDPGASSSRPLPAEPSARRKILKIGDFGKFDFFKNFDFSKISLFFKNVLFGWYDGLGRPPVAGGEGDP